MKFILSGLDWMRLFIKKMQKDRVDAYAAQSAYFVLMSFIPFIMLMLGLLQYTPLTKADMMNFMMNILPDSFLDIVNSIVDTLYTKSVGLISTTAIAAIWSCSNSVLAITHGLNSIHGLKETRNYLYMRLRSAIYMVALTVSVLLSIGLLVFGNQLHEFIVTHQSLLKDISAILISIRTIVTVIFLTLVFAGMYVALPNGRKKFIRQIPGAVFAAVSWCVFSYGFSLYIDFAQNTASIYGGLSTIILIMLWLYFCMWLIFLGAEVNCYIENSESFHLTD